MKQKLPIGPGTRSRALLLLLAGLGLVHGCASTPPPPVTGPVSHLIATDEDSVPTLAPMLERATAAVVNIASQGRVAVRENPLMRDPIFRFFFGTPESPRFREVQNLGSGVIVDARQGYILTNAHVIDKAEKITVTLRDGRRIEAAVVGLDPEADIAVIRIRAKRLSALPRADSDQLRVGDFVVAIGNPFGLGQTVTSGIVSALGRSGLGIDGFENFIQTDASINFGNSGGPLVNLRGELVGLNTAILSPRGGNVGIGFAIPSNMASNIMTQLIGHGKVKRGHLGVRLQDLTPDLSETFGAPDSGGAVITDVMPGSGAARAGLKPGDIILAIDGQQVHSAVQVRNTVGLMKVGAQVVLDVFSRGKTRRVNAVIAEREG